MEGKEIYILLMLALLCWPRPVASLATPCLASLATPCRFIDDALLALLGLTTETRPTHNRRKYTTAAQMYDYDGDGDA